MSRSLPQLKSGPPDNSALLRNRLVYLVLLMGLVYLTFWWLKSILVPFIVGMILAYFLNPVARRLERLGMSRLWATIFIFVFFTLFLAALLSLIIPLVYAQTILLMDQLPIDLRTLQDKLLSRSNLLIDFIVHTTSYKNREDVVRVIHENIAHSMVIPDRILTSILKNGLFFVQIALLVLITPVVTFYFLLDWNWLKKNCYDLLPRRTARIVVVLINRIDKVMASYIRGQISVCLFLGFFYAAGLTLLGMNFGLLVGFATGVLSFVPYVGAATGFMSSLGLVLIEYGVDLYRLMSIVALFALGQFIEGYYLTPQWVGTKVGLHPLWVMFALFAFGAIFGFVGVLVAVPISAALGVLVRFAIVRYKQSIFYLD